MSCIFGHTCATSLRLTNHTTYRNWTHDIRAMDASDRTNIFRWSPYNNRLTRRGGSVTSFNEANWGAFVWPNARSWPRGGGRRGRGITFCIRWAAWASRPTSSSTTGSKKLAFWCKMNIHEARKTRKLSSLSSPRRQVEKGRACRRWTRNSLLRTIKPFSAESPAALDRGIDICVAVHCRA